MGYSAYVTDTPYAAVFNSGCCPGILSAFLEADGHPGVDLDRSFRMTDFGCGLGMSLLVFAAAYPQAEFVGVDLNATHIREATERADRAGLKNLRFIHGAFSDPQVQAIKEQDIVTAQGVYSWIGAKERSELLELLARSVSSDGAIQLSYNLAPGFFQLLPVRELILAMINDSTRPLGKARVQAIERIIRLRDEGARFFEDNPIADEEVASWSGQDPSYIVHEFLNESWHLGSFSEVSAAMKAHGFDFAGLPLSTRPDAQVHLSASMPSNPVLQEDVLAFALSVPYRNDTFRRTSGVSQKTRRSQQRFGPVCPVGLPERRQALVGGAGGSDVISACLDAPKTIEDLVARFGDMQPERVQQTILDGVQRQLLLPYHSAWMPAADHIAEISFSSALSLEIATDPTLLGRFRYLPAPLVGGAVQVPPMVIQALIALMAQEQPTGWQEALNARLVLIPGFSTLLNNAQAMEILHQVSDHWVPFLVAAGVLRSDADGYRLG